jgi:hypothetical protein
MRSNLSESGTRQPQAMRPAYDAHWSPVRLTIVVDEARQHIDRLASRFAAAERYEITL